VEGARHFGHLLRSKMALRVDRLPMWLHRPDRYALGHPPECTIPLATATAVCPVGFWEFLGLELYNTQDLEGQGLKIDPWLDFCTLQGFPLRFPGPLAPGLRPIPS